MDPAAHKRAVANALQHELEQMADEKGRILGAREIARDSEKLYRLADKAVEAYKRFDWLAGDAD